jgi:stress response protein SCP2
MAFELDLKKSAADGFTLDLAKDHPTLTRLKIVVTWKEHPIHARSLKDGYDLDLSAFFLDSAGKVEVPSDVLYFKNPNVYGGAGVLPNDERAGGSEEVIFDYSKVPAGRTQIDHYVTIYEAVQRNQTFLMMVDAKATLVNDETGETLGTFALNDFTNDNALHLASSIRKGSGWEIKSVGKSASVPDLNAILKAYF